MTTSRERLDEKIRKPLWEALMEASILETQFRFEEAEAVYRKVISAARDWAKPRNDFAWFLIQRGIVIEPGPGKEKLKEAVEICRETIALNPKDKTPQDWATTQNNLGIALRNQGTRTGGEAGAELLAQHRKTGKDRDIVHNVHSLGISISGITVHVVHERLYSKKLSEIFENQNIV